MTVIEKAEQYYVWDCWVERANKRMNEKNNGSNWERAKVNAEKMKPHTHTHTTSHQLKLTRSQQHNNNHSFWRKWCVAIFRMSLLYSVFLFGFVCVFCFVGPVVGSLLFTMILLALLLLLCILRSPWNLDRYDFYTEFIDNFFFFHQSPCLLKRTASIGFVKCVGTIV